MKRLFSLLLAFIIMLSLCACQGNWEMLMGYYVTGLPMDLIHAAATVIFIMIAAEPMLEKLDRIKVKYGLVE